MPYNELSSGGVLLRTVAYSSIKNFETHRAGSSALFYFLILNQVIWMNSCIHLFTVFKL